MSAVLTFACLRKGFIYRINVANCVIQFAPDSNKHILRLHYLQREMSRVPKHALSLKQFMLRQEVLKLYREIFRCIKLVPDASTREDLKSWARHDFRMHQHESEESAIKILLGHGRKSLTELQNSLKLSGLSSNRNSNDKQ